MRRRVLSLFLTLLLCAGGCAAPLDNADEPSNDTTPTTDISPNTDTTITNNTTTESSSLTSVSDSSGTSHSTTGSTDVTEDASTSTITGQSIPSQSSTTNTSITNTTPSITSTTTTLSENTTITFKATVREQNNKQPVKGVTVTVYHSDVNTIPAGSGVTDRNGIAYIEMLKGSSYKVVLSNLPDGYEASNPYSFSSSTVNITIKKAAVRNEADHSGAQYSEGNVMTDFSLTDTDGKTHRLSDLLKEKQLVILDFWYVACEPCRAEFPLFESALKKYGDKITLLAIDPLDTNRSISDLRKKLNANTKTAVSFPMMQDTCNLAKGFSATSFPTTVFINSDGMILDIHADAFPSEAALCAAIERYLR